MENGTEQRTSALGQIAAVLHDHWELATLEMGYESKQAARRLAALVISCMFILLALIVVQVAVIYGLIATGLTPASSCLLVAGLYGLLGLGIFMKWGRRDARGGPAFAGTRHEVGKSLQWIQKLFS